MVSFESVIEAEETAADRLDYVAEVFYALYSAHCTDKLSEIAPEFNEKLTNYSSDVSLDSKLFEKIKEVYEQKESLNLTPEQKVVLENTYSSYTRNGALLSEDDKLTLRNIDQELSQLNLKFSENIRNATNSFELKIENEKELAGMPDSVIEAASMRASEKGHENSWLFTLDFPSYLPFMQYCQNRELRQKMQTAASTKACGGEFDNTGNVKEILSLRQRRAKLLGYKNHADFVLEKRMAKKAETVLAFLDEILEKSHAKAHEEFKRLKGLRKEMTGEANFERCDAAMYTEFLKKKELNFDDEVLKPYFQIENVIEGVFTIAKKLYQLEFIKRDDLPKYHEDVTVYEVRDIDQNYVGLFYTDFYPREQKRPGAWMTTFRNAGLQFGEVKRPFVSIVCNFTKPTKTKPSLLTLDEVLTLFHEFGHALHGLLAKSKYKSVAGTNVHWDFVELPSQIMENWVMEKECLDIFAKDYQTGELIPANLIEKIQESRKFLEAMATLRQLSFAYLDMSWHSIDPEKIDDVIEYENSIMKKFNLYDSESEGAMSPAFGHIFAGGYAAGYYSYKWAEVLDADAFELFLEKGIFNQEVAKSFKENILEKGGSEDPSVLYRQFRGSDPKPEALLKRAGLI